MAEFDVTLSAMTNAATNIANYNESFKSQADQVYQAAQTLSDGWQGDASASFVENMELLHSWMNEMSATFATYSEALNKACENYSDADTRAAGNFR